MTLAGSLSVSGTPSVPEKTDITIKRYTTVGQIESLGKIEVDALEIILIDQQICTQHARITTETIGNYPQSASAAIDHNRIDELIAAVNRLSSASISTDQYACTEFLFSIDNLRIAVFNDTKTRWKGKTLASVSVQDVTVVLADLKLLVELGKHLTTAKKHLDSNKLSFELS
jgi:hypothetical protein